MNDDRLTRFYGMPVPDLVARAVRERLTDQTTSDLFVAHLARNKGYFGAIDKTLSGFVLLDDNDDDAWLLDLRDTGAVWFQDHETRELTLRFATLDDYLRHKDDAEPPLPPTHLPITRELSTPELARRLQWAVWLFSQHLDGLPDGGERQAERNGIGWFHQEIGADPDNVYREERDLLHDDPHLAISWLLVAAATADPHLHADVVDAGPRDNGLFASFAASLADLGADGNLSILPQFRVRRARLLSHLALVTKNELAPRRLIAAARAAPDDQPLLKARLIFSQAKDMEPDDRGELLAQARGISQELGAHELGRALTGFLDAHEGLDSDDVKDALRLALDETAPLEERGFILLTLGEAANDTALRLEVARSILARDPFHFTALQHAAAAARLTGDAAADEIDARVAALASIRPLYAACGRGLKTDETARVLLHVHALPEEQRALFFERVLAAPDMFALTVVRDALIASVKLRFAGRGAAWARSLAALTLGAEDVLRAMQREMPTPSDDVLADLRRVLEAPMPMDAPAPVASMAREQAVKAIEAWMAAAGGASMIDDFLARLERADDDVREGIINSALNPFDKGYLVKDMSDAQAERAARVLVDILRTKKASARLLWDAAAHQLYRFHHRGAESVLLEALAVERDDDVLGSLYAAVRGLKTARSIDALIGRLFVEERAFWRMANALAEVWTDDVERKILAALDARPDAIVGANRYCAALVEHVKRVPPLFALAERALRFEPRNDDERRRLAYVVLECARVAALEKNSELARDLLRAADDLGCAPLSDYHSIDRDAPYEDPFDVDEALAERKKELLAAKRTQPTKAKSDKKQKKAAPARKPTKKKTAKKRAKR